MALLLAISAGVAGCGQTVDASAVSSAPSARAVSAPQTEPTVRLAESQLNAIRIEPVGTHPFSAEVEALGSIDFDEDLNIVQAESALISAATTLELSGKTLARVRDLYGSNGGIPQKELEQAVSEHTAAESALKAARDSVRALGKTDAEIDRMIASRRIEATPAAHGSTSTKWMVANLAESDSPLVRVGQPVRLTVAAHPGRVFKGTVRRVYAVVDPNTHRSKIRCQIEDPGNDLRPGMLANFSARVREPVEAPAIAADGVVREGDGTLTAWVTNDRRRFVQKDIKTGLRQDGKVEILAGLRPGELVVSEGGVFLSNLLQAPPTD